MINSNKFPFRLEFMNCSTVTSPRQSRPDLDLWLDAAFSHIMTAEQALNNRNPNDTQYIGTQYLCAQLLTSFFFI